MITIGNAALDNGMPKICVPIVGRTVEELIQECRYLQDKPYDVVELRIDFLADVTSLPAVGEALAAVRRELPNSALLFTFRTKEEGGETATTSAQFSNMTEISASGFNILIRAKRDGRWWILKSSARRKKAAKRPSRKPIILN